MPWHFHNQNLIHWINKVYPVGRTRIHEPDKFEDNVRITQRSLPPSMIFDTGRFNTNQVLSVNPAVFVDTVPVPDGKFWWVHQADFSVASGALGAGNALHAFIALVHPSGLLTFVGRGLFQPGDTSAFVSTHSIHVTSYSSPGGGGPGFFDGGGGGCGSFIVPQGYVLRGFVPAATPMGTAVLGLNWLFTECLFGEEIPSVG